jgi:Rrf2 family protein
MQLDLTQRAAYAIRAVVCLARAGEALTPSTRIADAMAIPSRFLPQVMGDLVRAGIVEARVGRSGGYRLARTPESVSMLEVVSAAELDIRRTRCVLRTTACSPATTCDVHRVFAAAQDAMLQTLATATIADAMAGR